VNVGGDFHAGSEGGDFTGGSVLAVFFTATTVTGALVGAGAAETVTARTLPAMAMAGDDVVVVFACGIIGVGVNLGEGAELEGDETGALEVDFAELPVGDEAETIGGCAILFGVVGVTAGGDGATRGRTGRCSFFAQERQHQDARSAIKLRSAGVRRPVQFPMNV
jgi:hypothetical protein